MVTAEAFYSPYLGHGEAVRILDAELGTLQREHLKDGTNGGRRRGVSRRELTSKCLTETLSIAGRSQ